MGHKNCADKKGGATSLDTFIALQPRQTSSAPRNGLANDAANVGGARAATTDAEGAYDLGAPPNAYDLGAPPNAYDLDAPPNVYDLGVPDADSDVDL